MTFSEAGVACLEFQRCSQKWPVSLRSSILEPEGVGGSLPKNLGKLVACHALLARQKAPGLFSSGTCTPNRSKANRSSTRAFNTESSVLDVYGVGITVKSRRLHIEGLTTELCFTLRSWPPVALWPSHYLDLKYCVC